MNKVKRWRKTFRWVGRVETREISIKLVNYTVAFNSKHLGSQLMQEFFFSFCSVQKSLRATKKEKARQMSHSRDNALGVSICQLEKAWLKHKAMRVWRKIQICTVLEERNQKLVEKLERGWAAHELGQNFKSSAAYFFWYSLTLFNYLEQVSTLAKKVTNNLFICI